MILALYKVIQTRISVHLSYIRQIGQKNHQWGSVKTDEAVACDTAKYNG